MGLYSRLFGGRKRLNINQRFELTPRKWRGANSTVYFVRDRNDGKKFALKILDGHGLTKNQNRFLGLKLEPEGVVIQKIASPFCISVIELGQTTEGADYLLMECFESGTLDSIASKNRIDLAGKCRFAVDMARAVRDVHGAGYVHRNICLKNFVVSGELSRIAMIDFAWTIPDQPEYLSRIGRDGLPLYMAPEVVRRKSCTNRIDIFSLGVSLYNLLTGQHPWGVTNTPSASAMQFDAYPPTPIQECLPELNERIAMAIDGCLAPVPEKRTPIKMLVRILEG